jgi:methionyl-tRNA formyltransferase
MKKLSIAYFGTPYFSANLLEKILTDKNIPIEVKFVVTQPDKPLGRKGIITPTPVKVIAEKYGITNDKNKQAIGGAKEGNSQQNLLRTVDLALIYAYGKIIPKELLSLPKYGFWNIHPSLLPKYRGPSPIAYPLINGDVKTGVTLIRMDEQIDHGPIIDQVECDILPDERRPELEKKLTNLGYELFKKTTAKLTDSRISGLKKQEHTRATFTKLLTKQDGFISFENLKLKIENSPKTLYNRFRGLYPWPGIWTLVTINGQEKRLKITDMKLKNGELKIEKAQLEGKKEVDFSTFQKAYSIYLI